MATTLDIDFREDIVPFSKFRTSLSAFMAQTKATHRPILVTQNGKAASVFMDVEDFEAMKEREAILQDIARGEEDIRAGRVTPSDEVFAELKSRFAQ